MKFTLIISGSGGQGVMSIGMSLAGSDVEGGLHATFMPLYGPEQRGGSAKCTVIVSDSEIVSPLPKQSDGLIVMNETSFKKFTPELKPGGVLVRNINRTTSALKRTDIEVVDVPADDLAHELGSDKIANIILIAQVRGQGRGDRGAQQKGAQQGPRNRLRCKEVLKKGEMYGKIRLGQQDRRPAGG